jgi:hypothetical protein
MARNQSPQRQRTQNNPLNLGSFGQISLRNLRGNLGPENKVVGYADTNLTSNGGFGGGAYNHWFKIGLLTPGWLIFAKGGPRSKYINLSTYDLNLNPIEGRNIFDADSVVMETNGEFYHPYVGHMMAAQSDLYNLYNANRLDKDDQRYFPLGVGEYLLCISSTRNEPISYEVAMVVEFPVTEFFLELEDYEHLLYEDTLTESFVEADVTDNYEVSDLHDHSLSEWQEAWEREHQDTDRFPEILVPLTTTP